jgi:hypothetical protein
VLPLMPAFALAISGRFADIGCVKRVAVPSLVIFLIAAGLMPWGNPWMLQQAEVGSLVKTLQKQAHADTATIFASGVRAHGLEFYLGKLVSVTEKDADIVLPMNAEQLARVVKNGQNCAKLFKNRPAYGIVRAKKYQRDFAPLGWTLLDQSGDFVLTGNAELLAREPTNASHP